MGIFRKKVYGVLQKANKAIVMKLLKSMLIVSF